MQITLEPAPTAVRTARQHVQSALACVSEEIRETAVLLVSELVTNALQHAQTDIEVAVTLAPASVRVEVLDGHELHLLTAGDPGPDDENGRGLFLLDNLADEWGVEPRGHKKAVWFALATAA